jgi:aminomethyltransferase
MAYIISILTVQWKQAMKKNVPSLFGRHPNAFTGENSFALMDDRIIIDLAGSGALPYLQSFVSTDVGHLTVPGMGLRCKATINDHDISFELYYFSEQAFRIFVDNDNAHTLLTALNKAESLHDIDVIKRADLSILAIRGDAAFNTLLNEFSLTAGIILTGESQRYARQAGNVFLTATHLKSHKGFELVAKSDELIKWKTRFIALEFTEKKAL